MHALIISPIPSDPKDQGNSVRIGRMCELLQYHGYKIHFVYYGLEGLTPDQEARMRARWDYFHYIPVLHNKQQTGVEGFAIDDFCGPELVKAVRSLQAVWSYDLAVVNYVWMSAAIAGIHPRTYCVIDTHDVFGGRHRLLQEQGLAPTWFYCSDEEESKGLNRADAVIAIQNEEAKVLGSRTLRPIYTVGHITASNYLPARTHRGNLLAVGYLASDNPSNRLSLSAPINAVETRPEVLDYFHFVIGGKISRRVSPGTRGFKPIGFVPSAREFYANVDIMVNPNISGTGLKIKSVECLSYGRPLISTSDGMGGIDSAEEAHRCSTVDDVVAMLRTFDDGTLALLADGSKRVFELYRTTQLAAFRQLLDAAKQHSPAERTS